LANDRIHKLERELARKEKALAEAAALLVLKKNSITCRRTRTMTPSRDPLPDRRGGVLRRQALRGVPVLATNSIRASTM